MNKLVEGSIAGAVGVALLMGGFGTFALWNVEEPLGEQSDTITTGEMSLDQVGSVRVTDLSDGVQIDHTKFRPVPGDKVMVQQKFEATLAGDNLQGELKVDTAALEVPGWYGLIDVKVTEVTGVTRADGSVSSGYTDANDDGVFEFTDAAAASGTFGVTVLVEFSAKASDVETQRNDAVNLTRVKLQLQQTTPNTA